MSTPRTKEPTKKAYHFPKSAKEPAAETKKPAVKASRTSEAKKAATVEQAPVVAPEAAGASPKATKTTKTTKTAGTVKAAKSAKTEKAVKPASSASSAANANPAKAPKEARAVKTAKTAPASAAAPEKKPRAKKEKEKVVRDSFTMPKSDYAKIAELKQRCLDAGISVKKSELLRAGLNLLAVSPAKRLIAAVQELEAVKTGRPAKT
ncbi:hypothetical protein [Paraburkholderia caribensis]|uniref:Uncharacterized protein n=1 Tax=Paraburkholderia caribensis TaxID=75105 RepID=A0A9Q6S337_9BURK|nr:hypothetical protein [Paraburkholderia caribensis]PTB27359.1 hypothetical protein C9I56_18575 [Paraburkholderia caribensis]QLB63688.1 hypothetical protein A9O66_15670 [Paraburkholderia caribensis]